jgi:carbamoyltransferase
MVYIFRAPGSRETWLPPRPRPGDEDIVRLILRSAGVSLRDIDAIATCSPYETEARFAFKDPSAPRPALPPFISVPHHLAHAEYAIHYAPAVPSIVLVADGSGTYEDQRPRLAIAELEADPIRHVSAHGKESISAYAYDGRDLRLMAAGRKLAVGVS